MNSKLQPVHVSIPRRKLVGTLASIIAFFSCAHLISEWVRLKLGYSGVFGLVPLFGLQNESNLPTFYSSFQLLLASALLAWVAKASAHRGGGHVKHWWGLSLVFLYLAIDESAKLHELSIMPLHYVMKDAATGVFYWPWVIPAMIAVTILGLIYFRWFFALPPHIRSTFFLSGVVFIGGAVGVEMAGASFVEDHGTENHIYSLQVWVEETFELCGVLIFIHGLLKHLETTGGSLQLGVTRNKGADETSASASGNQPG